MSDDNSFGSSIPEGMAYGTWDWIHVEGALLGLSHSAVHSQIIYFDQDGKFTADRSGYLDLVPRYMYLYLASDAVVRLQEGYDNLLAYIVEASEILFKQWQGPAAATFYYKVMELYKNILALRNQINSSNGANPIWQQLHETGTRLQHGQETIREMYAWYADQALALGAEVRGEVVAINQIPSADQMFVEDARTLLLQTVAGSAYNLHVEPLDVRPVEDYSGSGMGDSDQYGTGDSDFVDSNGDPLDPYGDEDDDGWNNTIDGTPNGEFVDSNNNMWEDSDEFGDDDDDGIANWEDRTRNGEFVDSNNNGWADSDEFAESNTNGADQVDSDVPNWVSGDDDDDGILNGIDQTPGGEFVDSNNNGWADSHEFGDDDGDGIANWEDMGPETDPGTAEEFPETQTETETPPLDEPSTEQPEEFDSASSLPGSSGEPVLDESGEPVDGLFVGDDGTTVVDAAGNPVEGYTVDDEGRIVDENSLEPLTGDQASELAESSSAGGFDPVAPFAVGGGAAAGAATAAATGESAPLEALPFGQSEFGPEVWGESGTRVLDADQNPVDGLFVGPDGEVVGYGGEEIDGYSVDDQGFIIDDATGEPLSAAAAAELAGPYTLDPADPGSHVLDSDGDIIPGLTVGENQSVIGFDGKPMQGLGVNEHGTLLGEDGEPLTDEEIEAMGLGGYVSSGGVNPFVPDEVEPLEFEPGTSYDPDVSSYYGENGPLNPNGTGAGWVPTALQSSPTPLPTGVAALSGSATNVGSLGSLGPLGQAAVTPGTSAAATPTTTVASPGTAGAAGVAGTPGMPMGGGAGGAGGGDKDGEKATWLTEEEDVWSPTSEVSPDLLGA